MKRLVLLTAVLFAALAMVSCGKIQDKRCVTRRYQRAVYSNCKANGCKPLYWNKIRVVVLDTIPDIMNAELQEYILLNDYYTNEVKEIERIIQEVKEYGDISRNLVRDANDTLAHYKDMIKKTQQAINETRSVNKRRCCVVFADYVTKTPSPNRIKVVSAYVKGKGRKYDRIYQSNTVYDNLFESYVGEPFVTDYTKEL